MKKIQKSPRKVKLEFYLPKQRKDTAEREKQS